MVTRALLPLSLLLAFCWVSRRRVLRPNPLRPARYRARHYFRTTEFAPRPATSTVYVLRAQRAVQDALRAAQVLAAA